MGSTEHYEIRVRGVLDGRWAAWFEGLQVSRDGGDTVLAGPVADQAALHGLLTKVRDLGLPLTSLRRVEEDRASPGRTDHDGGQEMTSTARTWTVDPELEAALPSFPAADLTDPAAARRSLAELAASAPPFDAGDLAVEDRTVPAGTDVAVRVYRPHRSRGAVVWLHGGGFVMGDLDTEDPWAARIAQESGATVISVGYRLAPEHPFPAALDDAYAVAIWAAEHAAGLGIDPARIAVGGHAAGAGLAAAVALRARDERGPAIRYQLLNQPELDDRQETWSARTFTDTPFMTRSKVAASWRHYLGSTPATPYAAPARATDLSGLPPAHVATAELDPNRDEAIGYALRLLQAGVPVELHQWAGTFHGSQAVLSAGVSRRQVAELGAALRRALAG